MKKHKLKIVFGIIILIIVILCLLVVVRKNNKEKQNYDTQVPVLIYHHFLSDEEKALYESTKDYSVKVSTFDKQMKYLYDNGYQSLTPQKMECWKKYECEIPPKSFMITIDDGQKSVLYYAQPILEKFAYPYNTYNNNFRKALKKAGYTLAFRGQSRKTVQSENSLMISRIFVSDDMDAFYDIFETSKYNQ